MKKTGSFVVIACKLESTFIESTSETAEGVNSGAEGKEAERGISNSHSGWVVTHVTCENP